MISSGQLSTPIEILEPTITTSDYGEEKVSWERVYCSTICCILRRSGRRAMLLNDVQSQSSREIIFRWRPGIHFRQRVRFPNEQAVFLIENITPSRRDGSITLQLSLLDE